MAEKRTFELEQLEQRIMLSADHLAIAPAEVSADVGAGNGPPAAEIIVQEERVNDDVPAVDDGLFAGMEAIVSVASSEPLSIDFVPADVAAADTLARLNAGAVHLISVSGTLTVSGQTLEGTFQIQTAVSGNGIHGHVITPPQCQHDAGFGRGWPYP